MTSMTVLGSGSSGNCTLIETAEHAYLIDCGFPPKTISERLAPLGRSWKDIDAVLLTHTHSDHWNRYTLEHLRREEIPLIAHDDHHRQLATHRCYEPLRRHGLVDRYDDRGEVTIGADRIRTLPVPHDAEPTVAIRIETTDGTITYASDIGSATVEFLEFCFDSEILALEFNHDVAMQRRSPRPKFLIDRVLGKFGHLSNQQATSIVLELMNTNQLPKAIFQLHLSRDCNTPELAQSELKQGLSLFYPQVTVITAQQHQPTHTYQIESSPAP